MQISHRQKQDRESREALPFAERMALGCNEYYNFNFCLVSYPETGRPAERRHFLKSTLMFSTACRCSSTELPSPNPALGLAAFPMPKGTTTSTLKNVVGASA